MMKTNRYSWLFRLACRVTKYFLLFVAGLTLVCLLSMTIGALQFALVLLAAIGHIVLRLAVFVALFMMLAIIVESIRS